VRGNAWLAATLLALAPAAMATPPLRPIWNPSGSYGESFTFVGDLDDGTYVQLTFSITNLGPGSAKGICRALVVGPGGGAWKAGKRFSNEEWDYKAGPTTGAERLTIGPCAAWNGEASGAEIPLEGGRVRLAFAEQLRVRAPPTAIQVGEDRYRTEVLLYRAGVKAEVSLPGEPPRALAGAGYVDHSRGTVPPKDLARRWVRFRGLRGERGLLLLGREARDGAFAPVWACEEPARCQDYSSFRLERAAAPRGPSFQVKLPASEDPVEIQSGTLLCRDAPVEEMGVLGKLIAPFVGSPVTYVYRARASAGGGREVEGILEVELSPED
jgi:hypothetical protein